jgi:hypothetical protein
MTTLVSVETTPNPNSMKLNLDVPLGVTGTFTPENQTSSPDVIQQLLNIEGIQSVFVSACFLALNRDPRVDWQPIINAAQCIFAGTDNMGADLQKRHTTDENQEQVQVLVQTFRGIPIQVKVTDGITEKRLGLPSRFGDTARELQAHFGADYLKERYWAEWGIRYGTLAEVAEDIVTEIESVMDASTLERQKMLAMDNILAPQAIVELKPLSLDSLDWHERLRIVQHLEASEESLSLLLQALQDEKPQIRRWAAAKLGSIQNTQSVEALSEALLNDPNVGVRRTAGDSLSDIGNILAQGAVCKALNDSNKLVRWRAARFLAEVGTDTALPYLEKAQNDLEYEIRLEVEAAINHIREGSKAAGPVWKLMSQEG